MDLPQGKQAGRILAWHREGEKGGVQTNREQERGASAKLMVQPYVVWCEIAPIWINFAATGDQI